MTRRRRDVDLDPSPLQDEEKNEEPLLTEEQAEDQSPDGWSEQASIEVSEIQVQDSSSEEMDYLSEYLDGVAPLEVARSLSELRSGRVITKKTEREDLSKKALGQLRESATEGIETKFEIMDSVNLDAGEAVSILSKAYRVDLRVAELRSVIDKFDMGDVFDIPAHFVTSDKYAVEVPAPGSAKVNLFKKHYEVDLETIKKACEFYAIYGKNYVVENLVWSGELILNCCSPDLRTRIETQMQSVPTEKEIAHKSGPVYFKIMMDFVVVRDSSTLRGLINQFEKLTVKDFPGENVRDYNTVAQGVYNMLANATNLAGNVVVPDMVKIIKRGLIASSTVEFNNDLAAEAVLLGRNCSVDVLTDKANELYSGLLGSSLWAAGDGKQGDSGFFSGNCYECGEPGHKVADCPKKKKDGQDSNYRGGRERGSGRGNGRGRGNNGGRGDRGGRGGRGNGRNGGRGNSGGSNDGEKNPYCLPPKKGESHTKEINNKTLHWCGRCNRWVDHNTDQHKMMLAMMANGSSDNKSSDDKKNASKDDKKDSGNFVGKLTPRF